MVLAPLVQNMKPLLLEQRSWTFSALRVSNCILRKANAHLKGIESAVEIPRPMGDDRAVRWLDGTDARPLVLQFADDHHAFHEDAKPGDRSLQFPIRWRSSSNQLVTTMSSEATAFSSSPIRSITNR